MNYDDDIPDGKLLRGLFAIIVIIGLVLLLENIVNL
jgi:hypothetical protein